MARQYFQRCMLLDHWVIARAPGVNAPYLGATAAGVSFRRSDLGY